MNEIYIANAHVYFKGNAADVQTLYRQLQEICLQNDIQLLVDHEIILRDEDGNDIDSEIPMHVAVMQTLKNKKQHKNNDDYYIKIGKTIANYFEEISFDRSGVIIYTDNKRALYSEITNALKSIENIQ